MSERVDLKQARGLAELLEAFADTDDEHSANKRAANVINQLCQEVEMLRDMLDGNKKGGNDV